MTSFWLVIFANVVSTILLAFASAIQVKTGFVGVVFRFSRFDRVLQPGLNFIIPFVERVELYPTASRQYELPDESDKIDRINDIPLPGMKAPFRVIHKGLREATFWVKKNYDITKKEGYPFDFSKPIDELKPVLFGDLPPAIQQAMEEDSVNAPVTSEPSGVFEWYLKGTDPVSIRQFVENVSISEGRTREEEIRRRAEDIFSSVQLTYLARMTLGHATDMLPVVNPIIKEKLEIMVGEKPDPATGKLLERPWGTNVGQAFIKPPHAGHTINEARNKAAAAVGLKQEILRKSEGEAQNIRNAAAANHDATILNGKAEKEADIHRAEGNEALGMADNRVQANHIQTVIIPAATSELTAANFQSNRKAAAYETNETVTVHVEGGQPLVSVGK